LSEVSQLTNEKVGLSCSTPSSYFFGFRVSNFVRETTPSLDEYSPDRTSPQTCTSGASTIFDMGCIVGLLAKHPIKADEGALSSLYESGRTVALPPTAIR